MAVRKKRTLTEDFSNLKNTFSKAITGVDPRVEQAKQQQRQAQMPAPPAPPAAPQDDGRPKTNIKHNTDGSVDVTVNTPTGKVTENLTKAEFKNQTEVKKAQAGGRDNTGSGFAGTPQEKVLEAQNQRQQVPGLGLTAEQIAIAEAQATNAPIDIGQAATAGIVGAAPSALLSAAGGIAAGSGALAATGVGAPIAVGTLAVAGALYTVAKLWSGVQNNIKSQQSGEIGAARDVLTAAKSNSRKLAALAAKDPANAGLYIEAYNRQLSQVYTARAKIKLETRGNLNKFTEDGTDILSDFDLYLQPMGQADLYRRQLEIAINSGIAPELTAEDVAND